jgi:hypothetical protein
MSIRVMTKVWDSSKAKGTDLLLLLAISDNANDAGFAFPGLETLMKKTRLSRPVVMLHIDNLHAIDELYIHAMQGRVHQYIVKVGKEADEIAGMIKKIEERRGGSSEYKPGKTYLRVKTGLREGEGRVYGGGKDGFTRTVINPPLNVTWIHEFYLSVFAETVLSVEHDLLNELPALYTKEDICDALRITGLRNQKQRIPKKVAYAYSILKDWAANGRPVPGGSNNTSPEFDAARLAALSEAANG